MTWGLPLRRYLKTSLDACAFRITGFDVGPVDSVSHKLWGVCSVVVCTWFATPGWGWVSVLGV